MSYFSYGAPAGSTDPTQGIVVSYIMTESMDDAPVMSDDGTEWLYTERTIRIRGLINGNLPPAMNGETPSVTLNRVRGTLETPRLQLFFYHNTQNDPSPLCQSPQPGFGVDARYGPVPKHVEVTRLAGSECLMVRLEYVTWVLPCATSVNPYISHRWTESVNIDESFITTKTRTGKVVVRADIGQNPDQLRYITAPPLDPGFRRIKSEYVLQSDGLAMTYTYVDEEQYLQPPLGAVKADGEYTESTADGGQRWGECRVHLVGPKAGPFADKANLMATAIQIVVQKLGLGGLARSNEGTWLAIGGVRESLWKNEVEVRFKTIIQPAKTSKTKGAAVDLSRFNSPLFGVDSQTQLPGIDLGDRGTALLSLVANVLNDPCAGQAVLTSGGQSVLTAGGSVPPDLTTLNTTIPATLTLAPLLPDDASAYDSTDPGGAYEEAQLRTRYIPDDQVVTLCTAKSGAPAAAVQLGQGTLTAVVEWSMERYNEVPKAPPTYSADPNLVFLRSEINPEEVEIAGDGVTPKFKLSGRYYYSYLDRSKAVINFPTPPYMDPQVAASLTAVPPSLFSQQVALSASQGTNILTTGNLPPPQQPASPF